MRFTVSTKPLKNAIELGIIKANVSEFFWRSRIVQITANRDTLKLNIQATGVKTRMTLKGSGDSDTEQIIMVDCLMFKSLVDSIDSNVMSLEFIDGGLFIHAGSSKFAVPKLSDAEDAQLDEPTDDYSLADHITITPEDWQYVKEHQMYAIATQDKHPVYKNAWVGADHEIVVGDIDRALFTYSHRGNFADPCLLPPTIINLFTTIPAGSKIVKCGRSYIIEIDTDSYSLRTEFTPKYEDDETVGNYHSDFIKGMMQHPEDFVTVEVSPNLKFFKQISLVSRPEKTKITDFIVADGKLTFSIKPNSYSAEVTSGNEYDLHFNTDFLKRVLSSFDAEVIHIAPAYKDRTDEAGNPVKKVEGCIFWTDTLTAVLAGVDPKSYV
jgi:hypothetical protein